MKNAGAYLCLLKHLYLHLGKVCRVIQLFLVSNRLVIRITSKCFTSQVLRLLSRPDELLAVFIKQKVLKINLFSTFD